MQDRTDQFTALLGGGGGGGGEEEESGGGKGLAGKEKTQVQDAGAWSRSLPPLGAYCSYQIVFEGVFTSLVLYLKRVRGQDNATAAATVSAVLGTGFCTSFLGAFLSDGLLGRFWTCILILSLLLLGCSFLSIITELQVKATAFFMFSLYLTGLAYGWFKPSLVALGGDQFHASQRRNSFFNQLYIAGTVGELFAVTVVIYLENSGHWALGYWICTGAVGVGLLSLLGMRGLSYEKRRGDPFKRILQVILAATRKFYIKLPSNPDLLFTPTGGRTIHTQQFRFLDKAAIVTAKDLEALGKGNQSPWLLCSVAQVEEVKSFLRVLPMWGVLLCKATAMSQLTSLFVEQGDSMDAMVGSFEVASASMSLFNMLARAAFAIVFYMYVRWRARAMGTAMLVVRPGLLGLTQIGISFIAATLSMLAAALVETVRLSAARAGHTLSILWLIPQYAFEGVAIVCGTVGEADFFYTVAWPSMRTLCSSFPVLYRGLGSFLSSLLVTVVTAISTADGNAGWIASDLDEGHLNYFFLLLAGVMVIAFPIFILISLHCSYPMQDED